ncbi:hydroxyisourate hydrolase [Gulosibacter sp. 10]|uniref:hydroxyisourate hydrolase n=1 Tax=Gulosibacter sp. 10 TaxID=1255570 RepID=UPI00097F3021|nr:hydroxyisourate hydrolase [Gulosibacter sp. 10]SJM69537.1 5-Hydroxyisourate Hydrolase (HIUase) [Gulosibacter sp. 10]
MSQITTHILDSTAGRPAADVAVDLVTGAGEVLATGRTNDDGRIPDLGPESLEPGTYRLVFAVGEYFARLEQEAFYPSVTIDFTVADGEQHYHVPLLICPFAYSTYRGS